MREHRTEEDYYAFVTRFERDVDFWTENPDLQYIEPYSTLIEDEGKKKSAKIMDAIFMIYDPKSSNKQKDRDEKEAQIEVAKYFLKDELFNWKKYKKIINNYDIDTKTASERDLDFYRSKIEEIKNHLRAQPISVASAEITDMMDKVGNYMIQAKKFETVVRAEKKENRLRAGVRRSRVERIPPRV